MPQVPAPMTPVPTTSSISPRIFSANFADFIVKKLTATFDSENLQ